MRTVLKFAKLAQALKDAQSGWTKIIWPQEFGRQTRNRPKCGKCGGVAVWQHKALGLTRCARCPRNEATDAVKAGGR